MSNAAFRIPSYRHHKATGRAVVTLGARDFYLGKYNSAASRTEYKRVIAEWITHHGQLLQPSADLSVTELLAAFLKQAQRSHSKKDRENFTLAARPLVALYGKSRVADFGPIRLKTVRQQMIDAGLARKTINERINRLRFIWKWGVKNELVPATNLHALQAVAGLRFGRSEARESKPVKPVPDAFVDEVLPFVAPPVAAMIELQRITGMRSGEVTIMRAMDLDASGKVWVYTVPTHKTTWRGHERKVYLGPAAQRIIQPYLKPDLAAYLFSPLDGMLRIWEARHAKRQTPLSYGNRRGSNCRGLQSLFRQR